MNRRILRSALFLALVLSTAACSGSSSMEVSPQASDNSQLSPDQLVARAADAISTAYAVHMVSKRFDQGGTVASNVYLTLHSGKATIRWKDRIIRLVRDRDDYYLQGNDAFWKWVLPADRVKSTLHTVHGNWIQVPPGDQTFGQFRPFVEFENVGVALGPPSEGDDFKRGPTKQVHGIAAISAIDTRGSGRGIIYFPKDGSAFPVRIVAGTKAVIDFYDWNVFVGIHEPPADQVVKLPK